MSAYGKPSIEQAVFNNIKIARSMIRLRHSIEADEELNEAMPRIRLALEQQAQTGEITGLSYDELRRCIYGDKA